MRIAERTFLSAAYILLWPFLSIVAWEAGYGIPAAVALGLLAALPLLAILATLRTIIDMGRSFWLGGDGVSYAFPFVTAAGALIKQVNRNFNTSQIVSILKDSGRSVGGYKLIDLDSAIDLAYQRSGRVTAPATVTSRTSRLASRCPTTPVATENAICFHTFCAAARPSGGTDGPSTSLSFS